MLCILGAPKLILEAQTKGQTVVHAEVLFILDIWVDEQKENINTAGDTHQIVYLEHAPYSPYLHFLMISTNIC